MQDLHFGSYMLDSNSVLSRDGQVVSVPPKELALLKLLLLHDGATVSHELIEQKIWPRQVVSYASIARCVYSLRKILCDSSRDYIVSVPKQGYKFGLPVCRASSDKNSTTAAKVAKGNPRAYSHFIEGLSQANIGSFESMQRAVKLFERACTIDPGFAVAHAAIADCLIYESLRGYTFPAEAFRSGLYRCERALEIDDRLASAHAARGWFYCVADDMNVGFESLNTGLSLDPDYAQGYTYLSFAQRAAGLAEESIATVRRAVELNRYSLMHRHALAWRLFCSGHAEEALEIERNHQVEYPDDIVAHGYFGVIAALMGMHEDALKGTERAARLSGNNPGIMTLYTYALACAGKNEQAKTLADALQTQVLPRAPGSHLSMTYVKLGDFDRALELLREAHDEKCPWFRGARFDPRIGELGADPRFQALYGDLARPGGSSARLAQVP